MQNALFNILYNFEKRAKMVETKKLLRGDMKYTGAKIITECLERLGVECIFDYPGGSILDIYDEIYHAKKLKHYLMATEQGATFAADGYARASGKVGVVLATSGPGATNLVTGIANSFLDSTPLVVFTGNVPTSKLGQDSFQEVDIYGITMPVVKYSYLCKDVSELEQTIVDAFEIAKSGRPGPVLIDIPKDVLTAKTEYFGNLTPQVHKKAINYSLNIGKAAALIEGSKRPFIFCGGGVITSAAERQVAELAETLDAPVGCTMMGRTAMANNSPYFVGMTGMHGNVRANYAKDNADLIIALGVRFSDRATCGDKFCKQKIIHVDIDLVELNKNVECDCLLRCDVAEFLDNLLPLLQKKHCTEWLDEIACQNESAYAEGEYSPANIIQALAAHMRADDIVATDVGQHQLWTAQCYPFKQPRTFLTSCGLGAMGYGLGAAIGGVIATGRRAVLITGDGSFMFNAAELCVAVQNKLPILVFIINNGALGMVKQWQTEFYRGHYCGVDIGGRVDFETLGRAYGVAKCYTITNMFELATCLDENKDFDAPVLINCIVDSTQQVLPFVHPSKM